MRIKVTRGFYASGKLQKPGTEVELADHVARELIWTGKAEAVGDKPVGSGPLTTKSAPELVKGKGVAGGG